MVKSEKLQEKIRKLKKALLIGGALTVGTGPSFAHGAEKSDTAEEISTSVTVSKVSSTNLENNQKSFSKSRHITEKSGGVTKFDNVSSDSFMWDLGEGYFMISSRYRKSEKECVPQKTVKSSQALKKAQYLVAPDGKSYDCSFIKNGFHNPDFYLEENDSQWHKDECRKIKKALKTETLNEENIKAYNGLVAQQNLKKAERRGLPADVVAKIGVYQTQLQAEIESKTIADLEVHSELLSSESSQSAKPNALQLLPGHFQGR